MLLSPFDYDQNKGYTRNNSLISREIIGTLSRLFLRFFGESATE